MINNPYFITSLVLLTITHSLPIKNAAPYNAKESQNYAVLSGLAYCPKKCLDNWSCKFSEQFKGMVEVTYINNDLTLAAAFVGYNTQTNQIVLSFRGSANIQNVIQDINVETVSYNCKGCQVHAGFYNDYLLIEGKVEKKVQDLLKAHPTATILSTGHSLGGSLSQIAGLRLKQKFNIEVNVHNFGSPRIGNEAMAQYVQTHVDSLYRVVHYRDLIPHFPSQSKSYHHSAFEVFWDEKFTTYVICNQSGEDKNCSNQFAPSFNFFDHQMYFVEVVNMKC